MLARPLPTLLLVLTSIGAVCFGGRARAQDDGDVRGELAIARQHFQSGRYWKCSEMLTEILDDPATAADAATVQTARVLLMRSESLQGHLEAADALDAKLAEEFPDAPPVEVLTARADLAFARGRIDDALSLGKQALSAEPESLHAAFLVARALRERGLRKEARDAVEEALAKHPAGSLDADGLLDRARLLQVIDDWERASEAAVHAEKKRRDAGQPTADVLVLLGDLYRLALSLDGEQPRAFAAYREALEQNGNLVEAKVGRALVHLYVWANSDAEKEIDEALEFNKNHPDALVTKGWIELLDGRFSDTIGLCDKALAVDPAHKKAHAVKAAALWLQHKESDYDAEVAATLALDPTYGELYWTVGDALSHHLRFEAAVEMHRKAIALDPALTLAPISLGRDLCFLGREEEGREELKKSLESHPFEHPWRHNMLLVLDKFTRQYVDAETEHFKIRIDVAENPLLEPKLAADLEHDRALLAAKYGWEPEDKVLVEMIAEHPDFSVRSVGFAGVGAVGVCFGKLVTLVSPRSELRHTFVWRRTALHELAHVFTIGVSKGRVPRWLTEGLSVYEERCAGGTWERDQELELIDAWWNDSLLRLRDFNAAFRTPRIGFAYYQAGLFCEWVAKTYGFPKILEMLRLYAQDLETPDVLQKAFGKSPEALDDEFRAFLWDTRLKNYSVQPTYGAPMRRKMKEKLRKEPGDLELMAQLAWAHAQNDQAVDADVLLDKVLNQAPEQPTALRLAARRALQRERFDLAETWLDKFFATGNREYFAAMQSAKLRSRDKDVAGAIEMLQTARACFPNDTGPNNPTLALREMLAQKGDSEGALALLAEHVARAESEVGLRLELANLRLDHGDAAGALELAHQTEDIDPFMRAVYVLEAGACRKLAQPADAIAALRTALLVDPRLEPRYSPAPSEAVAKERELDERSDQAELLAEIAEIEHEVGDHEAARRDLQRAMELAPDSERVQELKLKIDPDR